MDTLEHHTLGGHLGFLRRGYKHVPGYYLGPYPDDPVIVQLLCVCLGQLGGEQHAELLLVEEVSAVHIERRLMQVFGGELFGCTFRNNDPVFKH